MHPYEIMYTEYNEKGALTNIKHYLHPATVVELKQKYEELQRVMNTYINEETGETTTFKAYKVEVRVAVYKTIEDVTTLFDLFAM